ncbi:MAG: Gfo/Idh/MocA family protein [Phycisphaerae bacterium]
MSAVRFGVVGMGMGLGHARGIVADKNGDFCLTAVCDIVEEKARKCGDELKVPCFTDAQAMYDSGRIDAVIIAVPHYWHAPLAIRAARKGLHVISEKPLAVTVGAARAMIAECKKQKVVFGAMLQQRTRGVMMKARELVQSGALGEVFRVQMICSSWYRTQAYYESGAWRGTWDGEGGGILLNQAPHSLDLFQWLGGMPKRVIAAVGTRWHKIEVENTANAICDYGGGKVGYIYATTAEMPGMEQFMLCGDKATMIIDGGKLRLGTLKQPITEHLATSEEGFGQVDCDWRDVAIENDPGGKHINVIRAFAAHVLRGEPLVATGEEAINELELSNAIYIAGFKNKTAEIPVDAAEIDRLIAKLEKERSTGKGQGLRAKAAKEMRKLLGK